MAETRIRSLVPLAHVADMAASIAFYAKLGFEVTNQVTAAGEAGPNWAWLRSDKASLMIARAGEAVVPGQQAVLFYTYCDDVVATHAAVREAGLEPGPICTPFYNPGGEFRLEDPDGYVIYVAQI
jgi:catechol 2,3-dioxygenase-like lactoylglutathione lyase family enzyme